MKTIILYATKYGAAAEIARRIAAHIDGAIVHDLKQPRDTFLTEKVRHKSNKIGRSLIEKKTWRTDNSIGGMMG